MKWFLGLIIFVVCALGGRYISRSHFHGGTITPRVPAAIPKSFDYTHLVGEALENAVHRRLLTGTEFEKTNDGIELRVGHFVTTDTDGKAAFACDVYDRVTFTFEAEGFAVAGERPSLTVEGPCEMSENISQMKPLLIPVEQILGEPAGNLELNYLENVPVALKFSNMTEEWPRQWVLSGLKLSNKDDGRTIILDSKNLRQLSTNPLTMNW
jgi:hypothetical protein